MTTPLSGVRIWLAGSVPQNASPEEVRRIQAFVDVFAERVFRLGGTIVHGSHPSMRETLLSAALRFQKETSRKAPLRLVVSRYYSQSPERNEIDLKHWRDVCGDDVDETPLYSGNDDQPGVDSRTQSLRIMRQRLVSYCNAIVAIGGKWWDIDPSKAGLSEEIQLANESNLPLFLIGGMGGAVAGLLQTQPDLYRNCANGLSLTENENLASEQDPQIAVATIMQQLQALVLRSVSTYNQQPFRILCLDGGGIRGAYTAAVLAYWEKQLGLNQPGRRLVDYFDLVAGTSTGGILAIGLGLGMSAAAMQSFYVHSGKDIFGTGEGLDAWWHSFRHWFTSKFDQDKLEKQLETAFAESPVAKKYGSSRSNWMDNSVCRLLIATYNTTIDRPHVFRTPHGRFSSSDRGNDPVTVALASAAAPTYFTPVKAKASVSEFEAIDGGVWANSPVAIAMAEAIGELGIPLNRIHVLSIGTTRTDHLTGQPMQLNGKPVGMLVRQVLPWPFGWLCQKAIETLWKPKRIRGLVGWVANVAGLLMKSQSQTSDIVARCLLGDRYVRIDSTTQFGELDDVTRIEHFVSLGENSAMDFSTVAKVQALFLNGEPVAPWKDRRLT